MKYSSGGVSNVTYKNEEDPAVEATSKDKMEEVVMNANKQTKTPSSKYPIYARALSIGS
jgi:hypothetical protein